MDGSDKEDLFENEDSCYDSEGSAPMATRKSNQRTEFSGTRSKNTGIFNISDKDRQIQASKACKQLQKNFRISGWPGYKEKELVIVMFSHKQILDFPNSFETFKTILITDNENTMSSRGAPRLLANDVKYCRPIIETYGPKLMDKHSNISMIIPTAYRIQQGKILAHVCIAIYCRGKGVIPLQENSFPTTLEGIDIDVREGYCFFGMRNAELQESDDYHQSLRIGVEIGWPGGPQGTLGGFIKGEFGEICFLTCAHVLFSFSCLISSESFELGTHIFCSSRPSCENVNVLQPSQRTDKPTMGRVKDAVFKYNQPNITSVDAALVVITDHTRVPTDPYMTKQSSNTSNLRRAGFSENNPPHFSTGEIIPQMDEPRIGHMVVKCGAVSGLTHGVLALDGGIFRLENQEMQMPGIEAQRSRRIVMYRQYLVESINTYPFFQIGDSGSLVFMHDRDDLKCIGMAIGNTTHGGCIVTPIEAILNAFKIDNHGNEPPFLPFNYGSDDDYSNRDSGDGDDDDDDDGFDNYQTGRQKRNRGNNRSNKSFQSSLMDHSALNTQGDCEEPRKKRLRSKRRSVNRKRFDVCSFASYDSEDNYKLKATSRETFNRKQQSYETHGESFSTLRGKSSLLSVHLSDLDLTVNGLHKELLPQTKSNNDIPNESDGNTGCGNDFDGFISNENIKDTISNVVVNKIAEQTSEHNIQNGENNTNASKTAQSIVQHHTEVIHRTRSRSLHVVGNDHIVVCPDITILPIDKMHSFQTQILVEKKKDAPKKMSGTKKKKYYSESKILRVLTVFFYALFNQLFGSDQGTHAASLADILNRHAKTKMDK